MKTIKYINKITCKLPTTSEKKYKQISYAHPWFISDLIHLCNHYFMNGIFQLTPFF